MDLINKDLTRDFNLAVDAFNAADYNLFFRNIRPAIENLSKFLVIDILGNDTQAIDLIDGKISINKPPVDNSYIISKCPAKPKPVGGALPLLFSKVFYYKHPDVYSPKSDTQKRHIKQSIDSYEAQLRQYYSIASEIGSHSGGTSLDVETQAISCASCIMGFFDYMKSQKLISKEAVALINSFRKFSFGNAREKNNLEVLISKLTETLQQKEQQLQDLQQLNDEASQRDQQSKQKIENLEAELSRLEEVISSLQSEMSDAQSKEAPATVEVDDVAGDEQCIDGCQWGVAQDLLDEDQLDLIESAIDKSMLVEGCAGSGKSLIAMFKAIQLSKAGYDVILIAYTTSLYRFMQNTGSQLASRFYYYSRWEAMNKPSADYIIVDEIQDFDRQTVSEFIRAARKHFLFFGDTAQSIYRVFGYNTMSIEDIAKMTNLKPLRLYSNYRLPRPVAKITQTYVGVNVPEYKERVYQSKATELPHFVFYESDELQLEAIAKLVSDNQHRSVGIIVPTNRQVQQVVDFLKQKEMPFECKYKEGNKTENTLNFKTQLAKIMTCHSAKGLQFDVVILPFFKGADTDDERKILYVAMTRTIQSLYLLYSAPAIPFPLNVPEHLYLKS